MKYTLWIDDIRNPNRHHFDIDQGLFLWARDVEQAIFYVKRYGPPAHMYLDHDLGTFETVMTFLKWLSENYPAAALLFDYTIISDNPVGRKNIQSFLESWKKSLQ